MRKRLGQWQGLWGAVFIWKKSAAARIDGFQGVLKEDGLFDFLACLFVKLESGFLRLPEHLEFFVQQFPVGIKFVMGFLADALGSGKDGSSLLLAFVEEFSKGAGTYLLHV